MKAAVPSKICAECTNKKEAAIVVEGAQYEFCRYCLNGWLDFREKLLKGAMEKYLKK